MVGGIGGPGAPGGGGKIGGPGAPPPASPSTPGVGETKRASFGEVSRASQANAGSSVGAAGAATPLDRLRTGEIDLKTYVEVRVQDATAHLEGVLPASDIEKIRADLHDLIENDPDVAALVKAAEVGSS